MANDLVIFHQEDYLPMAISQEEFAEAVTENLGGSGMNSSDLMRIKVPSGGGLAWEINGEPEKKLKGIIVFHSSPNAFWAAEFDGQNNPPDCFSPDGHTGIGDPGGACATCPMNQFGSASKGKGKACKNMRRLYILMADAMLPVAVNLPPTSLKAYKQYTVGLTTRALPYWGVETVLTLKKEKSADGIDYSAVEFALGPIVPKDSKAGIRAYRDAIIPMLQQDTVDAAATGAIVDE